MSTGLVGLVRRFPLTCTVAAMVAWALHFIAVYGAVGLACARGFDGGRVLVWLAATTLLALAACGAVVAVGITVARGRSGGHAPPPRRRFLGRLAAALGVLAAIAIVYTVVPAGWIRPCS